MSRSGPFFSNAISGARGTPLRAGQRQGYSLVMSDKMSFDEWLASHNIDPSDAAGETFAAYLHYVSDGAWDGEVHKVEPRDGGRNG